MLNLCKIDGAQDYFLLEGMYAMTLIVWIYQRLYIFPKVVIEKAWMVLPTLYPGLSFGEIFKKEWPQNWTSFVHDLVTSALESESRCRNSIFILKIVVEDVALFSATDK